MSLDERIRVKTRFLVTARFLRVRSKLTVSARCYFLGIPVQLLVGRDALFPQSPHVHDVGAMVVGVHTLDAYRLESLVKAGDDVAMELPWS